MSTVDVLAEHGIVRPSDTIAVAKAVGLDLAVACTLLMVESSGGRNIWGHDPVPTDGAYTKGGPVTEANYKAYRRSLAQGRAGPQGCGPTQLTWLGYQDAADRAGGCWDWTANCTVGFRTLRGLQGTAGLRVGFRRYNGSGPAAERYAVRAMQRLADWRRWLDTTTPDDVPPPRPTLRRGDTGTLVELVQRFLGVVGPGQPGYGQFGPKTQASVERYQRMRGIPVTGEVDATTWLNIGL